MVIPAQVLEFARRHDLGEWVSEESLQGGLISRTRRLNFSTGSTLVLKQCETAPPGLYPIEADGLNTLRVEGGPRIPTVLAATENYLLLEDLGKGEPGPGYWQEFGRRVAILHSNTNDKFGYHQDNYLGILLLDNTWTEDGHEFFGRTRILRFLQEPKTIRELTAQEIKQVESIAKRLPDLVPYQPPSLLHGDLWTSNMPCAASGEPCLIDPAVYYGWPEAELSMAWGYDGVDPGFFDAYREMHPLEPGWEERMELLNIRELLSMIAHTSNEYDTVTKLREVLDKFA
jgi:fructosamine-3-kinase